MKFFRLQSLMCSTGKNDLDSEYFFFKKKLYISREQTYDEKLEGGKDFFIENYLKVSKDIKTLEEKIKNLEKKLPFVISSLHHNMEDDEEDHEKKSEDVEENDSHNDYIEEQTPLKKESIFFF